MIDPRLFRLRLELFTAAQTLKGEDAEEFWRLLDEVLSIKALAPEAERGRGNQNLPSGQNDPEAP